MRAMPRTRTGDRATASGPAWSRYRDNCARHLIGIARDLQARLMHELGAERGFSGLRPSLGPFLSLVWTQGRALGELAAELAISKQACTQLANLAEAAEYLERHPDPADRRCVLVRLTPRGRALVEAAVEVMLQLESDYAARAGVRAYRGFATSLAALYRGLQIPTHANPAFSAAAGRSIGVLPLVAMRIQQDLMSATIARGHPALKLSFAQVIPLIGPRGGRVHEIARLQRTSRQAISATARELAALGYVRRDADPHDGRGALLVLTTSGSRLILDSLASLDALESRFGEILGKARLASLQRVARDLYRSLHLEQAIFEDASDVEPLQSSARSALALAPDDIERIAMRLHAELGDAAAEHLALRLSLRARRTA